jgi:hypothetical protein
VQPAHRAQALFDRKVRTFDRFGRLPAGSVQPGPDVHRLARTLSYSPYIGLVLVSDHFDGDRLPPRGGSDEEGLGAGQGALSPQQDIYHLAPFVDSPVQVCPPATDPDVRFIAPPSMPRSGSQGPVGSAPQKRAELVRPTQDGPGRHVDMPFGEQISYIGGG